MKQTIIRTGLETLYFTGMHHLMRPLLGGVGVILTLHHVRPRRPEAFQPNHLLEVTPEFFERLLRRLKNSSLDVISLDEMHARYFSGDFKRRFVCITFDDGYKDLMRFAYPLLKQYELPFALYIPTSFPDRLGELWWLALETVIAQNSRVGVLINGESQFFDCRTVGTVNHNMLKKMDADAAVRAEMDMSRAVLQTALGKRPQHLAYPVGDPTLAGPRELRIAAELGFKTAVTTRPGVLFKAHRDHLTALPRLSVNGDFQRQRYLEVLMSGAATAAWNGFRRVNAA